MPTPGISGYVHPMRLLDWTHEKYHSRFWSINGRVTTVMIGKDVYKDATRFAHHCDSNVNFSRMLEECADAGCPRPSSYADAFHAKFYSPRVRASFNNALAPGFVGGWQSALVRGSLRGTYYRYDIVSAYLWATTMGLPLVSSFRLGRDIGGAREGVYRVRLKRMEPNLPYPFNVSKDVLVSTEELDNYPSLPIDKVLFGVEWSEKYDNDAVTKIVQQFTFAKHISKSFWGRWCGMVPVKCHSKNGRVWRVGNPLQNLVWAHLLVSRVKLRLWEILDDDTVHVFVDSAITRKKLPESLALGGWRLEQTYTDGIKIRSPGFYGPRQGPWERTSGQPRSA